MGILLQLVFLFNQKSNPDLHLPQTNVQEQTTMKQHGYKKNQSLLILQSTKEPYSTSMWNTNSKSTQNERSQISKPENLCYLFKISMILLQELLEKERQN